MIEVRRKFTTDYENETKRIRQLAREVAAYITNPEFLNNLHPFLSVWTNDEFVAMRFRGYGVRTLNIADGGENIAKQVCNEWLKELESPPGREYPLGYEGAMDLQNAPIRFPLNGEQSWQGPNLLVNLGDDPSSTLLALCTHKPKEAIILADATTPKWGLWLRELKRPLKNT